MRFLVRVLSLLPLWMLYAISQGFVYPVAYYIIGYRKKVVRKNLKASFPEKNDKELRNLEKDFYHGFADLFAEIIHGYRMSDEEWHERVRFVNIDEVEKACVEYGGVIAMLGHMGCWEWLAGFGSTVSYQPTRSNIVYMRLKSKSADKVMFKLREKRHCIPLEMRSLLRTMLAEKNNGVFNIYGFLCDQKPPSKDLDCWTNFLNQQVPFITGPERLAKKLDYPVVYVDVTKKSRGYYDAYVHIITLTPNQTEQGQITREYAKYLERNILRKPEIWLWSHNRFKWKIADANKE